MSPLRMARDLRDLYRSLSEMLVLEDSVEEAGYELAVSARDFSRNTQAVVDDKLNFSATLMRAGEVAAANRLLEEFERDVREEEAALIEKVNEVKVAEAIRSEGMTRVRLARVLAVALVGSSLLSFSAAGMALAGLLKDRAAASSDDEVRVRVAEDDSTTRVADAARKDKAKSLRHVRIGDVKLLLTASQLRTIRELGGTVDAYELEGIIGLLPQPLAEKVQNAIVVAAAAVDQVKEPVVVSELPALKDLKDKAKRKARQAEKAAAEAEAEAEAEEAEDEAAPTPSPSEQPTEQPTPDDPPQEEEAADDEGRGGAEDDEDDEGLRLPGDGDDWR